MRIILGCGRWALREVLSLAGLRTWEGMSKAAAVRLSSYKGRVCFGAKKEKAELIDGKRAVIATRFLSPSFMRLSEFFLRSKLV